MRTDLNLRERVALVVDAALHDDGRSHTVEATIAFWFHGRELPVPKSELRQAILVVDAQAPWKDETKYRKDLKSIHYLDNGEGGMNNWGRGMEDCNMFFSFSPQFSNLRKGQVQAYKNYAYNLGRLLMTKGFPNIKRITVRVTEAQSTQFEPTT